jgi:hypothetical protein
LKSDLAQMSAFSEAVLLVDHAQNHAGGAGHHLDFTALLADAAEVVGVLRFGKPSLHALGGGDWVILGQACCSEAWNSFRKCSASSSGSLGAVTCKLYL